MSLKIKLERLNYQEKAVESICNVFNGVSFVASDDRKSNPSFSLTSSKSQLIKNIKKVRESNGVEAGEASIDSELVIDTLMETGERVIIVMGAVNVMKPRVSGTLNKYILCIA